MKKLKRNEFWNIANSITMFRIFIVPAVMVLIAYESPVNARLAAALFILASLSDLVDGYFARKYNLESVIGAFLDPLADKLLVAGAMIMMIPHGWVPAWMVAIFILRDTAITALRAIAASEGLIISASNWGKYKTAFEVTALSFVIFHYDQGSVSVHDVGIMLLFIALGFSVISGAHYLREFFASATE